MASNSGAQVMVKVGFDDSGRDAFIAGNERAFKSSSQRIAAHEQQARRGSAFSGGQNAAYRVGMVSQQAQDVAVSLQMGMSASRVIAQQGSQIASIFGPTGMVIGGVIAIGAAIAEWALNTKEADKAAERYKKTQEEINEIAKQNIKNNIANKVAMETMDRGPIAGKTLSEELEFEQKKLELEEKRNVIRANAAEQRKKQGGWHWTAALDFDTSASVAKRQLGEIDDEQEIAAKKINIARETALRKRNTEADMGIISDRHEIEMAEDLSDSEKEIAQNYYNFKKRLIEIELSDQSDLNKALLSQSAENLYAANQESERRKKKKEDAANFLKYVEKEAKINEEKYKEEQKISHFRDTAFEKYSKAKSELKKLEQETVGYKERDTPEHQLEVAKKKLEILEQEKAVVHEIESARAEGMEFTKAGLAGTEAQKKMEAVQLEINLLEKKKAFSPIEAAQTANKIALLNRELVANNFNTGAMGATGMQQMNRNRESQLKAMDKAEQRALGNMGLTNIKRGLGGEMIGGVDPITGRVLDQKEIEARKFDMGLEKDRRDLDRAQTKGDIDKQSKLMEKQVKQKSDLEDKAAKGDKEAQKRLNRLNMFKENGGKEMIAAGFSPEQIAELSNSIADAVSALLTK